MRKAYHVEYVFFQSHVFYLLFVFDHDAFAARVDLAPIVVVDKGFLVLSKPINVEFHNVHYLLHQIHILHVLDHSVVVEVQRFNDLCGFNALSLEVPLDVLLFGMQRVGGIELLIESYGPIVLCKRVVQVEIVELMRHLLFKLVSIGHLEIVLGVVVEKDEYFLLQQKGLDFEAAFLLKHIH